MQNKPSSFLIILLSALVLGAVIFAVRIFSGAEDTWICNNGTWVKHGNPSSPAPAYPCK